MLTIERYQITEFIYKGTRTEVYRAIREADQTPVILKKLRNEYPTFNEMVQFRHQYAIAKNLEIPGIVKPIALETYGHSYLLVMPDVGGLSLSDYTKENPLNLEEFLSIAIALSNIIESLYENRVIHKDIKPANILINPESQDIKLIDFSIASLLPKESQILQNPNVLEGTLSYISPEQTGRMNRGIDYRSDFYSLGVTFYELLTGQLPFISDDAMELVHCHLAKNPTPPHELKPEIPRVLSELIVKLMAKTAEDRYQSAGGIRHDLQNCLQQWQATQTIQSFQLAKWDSCDRFSIPEKLYGREREVQSLLDAFERVANPPKGKPGVEMMLVAGFSGIGKTAVVNEVHKPIIRQRGYFIKGKFDQFQRNIPFSAFVQAFRELIQQLLTESSYKIALFQGKLLEVLGQDGQVIIDVIPEVELLIGPQPTVSKLSSTAAQNRFNLLFSKFVQVFTSTEHPLVIFLDDLQWADIDSLKFIKLLIQPTKNQSKNTYLASTPTIQTEKNFPKAEERSGGLLLIGAYRDNEVSRGHPLMLTLQEIRKETDVTCFANPFDYPKQGIGQLAPKVNQIFLRPLDLNSLNQLITETLTCSPEQGLPLSKLVHQKTQGNPFFATQFINFLYEQKVIYYIWLKPEDTEFSSPRGYWQCDLAKVKALAVSKNVLEFMVDKLKCLSENTQNILKVAACIGNQFDLETLAIACNRSLVETAANLWNALQAGVILPNSETCKFFQEFSETTCHNNSLAINTPSELISYKFLHDRVQQAAYLLIAEEEKQSTHLKIAQLLLTHTCPEDREERIFAIVNQLNLGQELVKEPEKQEELAQLNLQAGAKALESTAYEAAKNYLHTGLKFLKHDCWESQYDLTLGLYNLAVEAAYLNGEFELAQVLIERPIKRAKKILDKIYVYEIKIQIYSAQQKMQAALDTGLEVLQILGVSLIETPPMNLSPTALDNLPKMTDPHKQAAMRILMNMESPAYHGNPEMMPLLAFTMVHLSIEHGNSPTSAYGYVLYGFILCLGMSNFNLGYQFGQLAMRILDKFETRDIRCKVVNVFNCFIRHWKEHTKETIKALKENVQLGLQTGDLEYGSYAAFNYCHNIVLSGEYLEEVDRQFEEYLPLLESMKQEFQLEATQVWGQLVLNLRGKAVERQQLIGEMFDETDLLDNPQANPMSLYSAYHAKNLLAYLFEDYENAIVFGAEAQKYEPAMATLLPVVQNPFYYSLSLLAKFVTPDLDWSLNMEVEQDLKPPQNLAVTDELKESLEIVAANQQKLKVWANHAPMNFQHKYDLVAAEKARVLGKTVKAIAYYDRAIQGAKENGYIQEEALANELAAKFYLAWDKEKMGKTYLIDAYYGYSRWGTRAKIKHLEKRYPEYFSSILKPDKVRVSLQQSISKLNRLTATYQEESTRSIELLNLATVMKAAQALSGEIKLDKLLDKLMQVLMENAGAQIGVLLLPENERWTIAVYCCSEKHCEMTFDSVTNSNRVPLAVINYVSRTGEKLVIHDARNESIFANDPYIIAHDPKSILCLPLQNQGQLVGMVYLENNLITGAFRGDRLEVLKLLSSQAAISIENARLYEQAQNYGQQLEKSLEDLKEAQLQLVQNEKMAGLGQLVSGVAHEINNPIGFISGNLEHTEEYTKEILNHLRLYQKHYPNPVSEILESSEEIDLEYLLEDLPKMIKSMKEGSHRIQEISKSMRTFSRADRAQKVSFNLHEGIESTLLILKHRLKANEKRMGIKVIKDYADLPEVECYPGQLNQVFMNVIANGIDALEEFNQQRSKEEIKNHPNQITIQTAISDDGSQVMIKIKDNGSGMNPEVQAKIFEHLYTTKPVGKGTGLGLSISRKIVVEKHGGNLTCTSELGKGTEFAIALPV